MRRLTPHSQAADTERLASAVEAFLNADLTAEGSQQ